MNKEFNPMTTTRAQRRKAFKGDGYSEGGDYLGGVYLFAGRGYVLNVEYGEVLNVVGVYDPKGFRRLSSRSVTNWQIPSQVPGADEPETVGPFPQEPAPGSAEAVAQAAETIRGFTPGPWTLCHEEATRVRGVDGSLIANLTHLAGPHGEGGRRQPEEVTANGALVAAAPDLLRERDELRAEVERLRAELADTYDKNTAAFREGSVALDKGSAEIDRLRDQISRLRAETNNRISSLVADQEAAGEALSGVLQQRDALADALEAFVPKGCECSDNDCLTARVALRLAGRLP